MQAWSDFDTDATIPAFDFGFRGYERGQVDDHLDRLHARLAECGRHYESALEEQAGELERLRQENSRFREALAAPYDEPAAVAARVEQILAAARMQAAAIVAKADQQLKAAEQDALQARRDFELALASRRHEASRSNAVLAAVLADGNTGANGKATNGKARNSKQTS